MNRPRMRTTVFAAALVCCLRTAVAEKVFFRDELTGCEIWRISNYETFHEYWQAAKPFSYDGRRAVCRWRRNDGIVAFDLADGSEIVFGRDHRGDKEAPGFVRGREAVVYNVGRRDGSVYLYDLRTGRERLVVQLEGEVRLYFADVIGPESEYIMLRGDMNADGMLDWGFKSLWTDEPPRIVWTSPVGDGLVGYVTPSASSNRVTFCRQICTPEIIRRVRNGEKMRLADRRPGARWLAHIATVDLKTLDVQLHECKDGKGLGHVTWSGDGKAIHSGGYSWVADANRDTLPVRIGDAPASNHNGCCGASGRYVAGDSGRDNMTRLEIRDLWTGECRTVAYISTTTEPVGAIAQDHGHPAGCPDGTKVMFHSCYDLANHRLFAVPTADVHPGDATIAVETTEGFARQGRLLIGYGGRPRLSIPYERIDATHFYDCGWGDDAEARLRRAISSKVIRKGSHEITDAMGRLFPNGERRPRKDYIAVVKQPDPPRVLTAQRLNGQRVKLTWQPPASHVETAGYAAYRRVGRSPVERINRELVSACTYTDTAAPTVGKVEYFVRAVEHCGLYGDWSGPAWAEGEQTGAQVLDSYDIRGCNYVETGHEPTSDRRSVAFRVLDYDEYVLWVRGRAWQEPETLNVSVDGSKLPNATVDGIDWHWIRLGTFRLSSGGHTLELSRVAKPDVDQRNLVHNSSFEDGLEGWGLREQDKDLVSLDHTRARSGKQCVKLSGDLSGNELAQQVKVRVKPDWRYRLSFWLRGTFSKGYRGLYNSPSSPGAILAEVLPLLKPLRITRYSTEWDDERWHHIEVEYQTRCRARGEWLSGVKVRPLGSPRSWRNEGTLWLDDVSFAEIGPRLRPAKVTKLLVTNVPNYQPKGLDGRGGYNFPRAPICRAVANLRQKRQIRNGMTLAWGPGRVGTRGYNVYLNRSGDCSTTKYFRKTSVWGHTSATLRGLERAATYTVKVTAINEDGVEGPAAANRATTVALPPEEHVLEAERGRLAGPVVVKTERGITFVETPADPSRIDELYDPNNVGRQTGAATFELTIEEGGEYLIRGRTFAPHGGSNSFWYSLDGRPERMWNLPNASFGKWAWTSPGAGTPVEFEPGKHTITVRTREAGTRLDRIVVTNDIAPARLRVE